MVFNQLSLGISSKTAKYEKYPLLGSWKEAAPFSKPCAIKIKNELEKELTCGKAVVDIIEK
ncbi:hypothetical protein EfmAA96_10330 [Enterococcus faecium]|nr:hypothetical protein EfmAA96_10330 [Enterococcus faecium]